jgi:hypothetical protein
MFDLGMNNNGTGLVPASMAMADHPSLMLPIIFCNMIQHPVHGGADSLIGRRPGPPDGNEAARDDHKPAVGREPLRREAPRHPA